MSDKPRRTIKPSIICSTNIFLKSAIFEQKCEKLVETTMSQMGLWLITLHAE